MDWQWINNGLTMGSPDFPSTKTLKNWADQDCTACLALGAGSPVVALDLVGGRDEVAKLWKQMEWRVSFLQLTVYSSVFSFVLIWNMVLVLFPVSRFGSGWLAGRLGGACCRGLPERPHHAFPLELAAFGRGGTSCSCCSALRESRPPMNWITSWGVEDFIIEDLQSM